MNARAESPFDACLQEALVLSAEWIPRWLGALYEALQQREANATSLHDKQSFGEARGKLETHRALLGERVLARLTESVQGSQTKADTAQSGAGRSLDSLSFDDLELMDHDQVQETVELARVQQVVKMAADEEFVAFNARLTRAQGLDVVNRHAKNPLGPEVVVGALMRALRSLHLSDSVRARWLNVGAVPLGSELEKLYRRLADQLDRWGVQPASFQVVQRDRSNSSGPVARGDSVPAAAMVGSDALLTLDHLHQLLTGNLGQGEQVSDQGASGSGNAMVRTLASEVVTLMLRRITEDQRLLKPVRELVAGLKPALLQLARSDPRFFADRHNPARRLLDIITERALAFTSEQDAGYEAYAQQVSSVVRALQGPSSRGMADRLPEQLLRLTQAAVVPQAAARGLAMQTLVKVEQRNLLAERVASEMQSRNDFARAPGVVRRFLAGPWSQVVAQARMAAPQDGSTLPADAPALRYMDVLPDLLWSSQLALASRNRPRLIKVIPGLLRTLREGLDSIDFPRAQAEAFFQALMGLHEAAYKTHHNENPVDSPLNRQGELEAGTWVQPAEARDSGFMDDQSIESIPAFQDTEPLGSDWQRLRENDARSPTPLGVGAWIELRAGSELRRCQLTWASPHGTLFLFNDVHGRSLSLTQRGLERLLAQDRLRVVADQGLVDDALNGVARQALDNSGKL